jgi:hypothetical protein
MRPKIVYGIWNFFARLLLYLGELIAIEVIILLRGIVTGFKLEV